MISESIAYSLVNSWVGPLILRKVTPSEFRDEELARRVLSLAESLGLVARTNGAFEPTGKHPTQPGNKALARALQTLWNRAIYSMLVHGSFRSESDVEQSMHRLYRALQPIRLAALSELDVQGSVVLVAGYHPCGMGIDVINAGADLVLVEELEWVTRLELGLIDSFIPQLIGGAGGRPAPGAFYIYVSAPMSAVAEIAQQYKPDLVLICHQARRVEVGGVGSRVVTIVSRGVLGKLLDIINHVLGFRSEVGALGEVREIVVN